MDGMWAAQTGLFGLLRKKKNRKKTQSWGGKEYGIFLSGVKGRDESWMWSKYTVCISESLQE